MRKLVLFTFILTVDCFSHDREKIGNDDAVAMSDLFHDPTFGFALVTRPKKSIQKRFKWSAWQKSPLTLYTVY